MNLTPINFTAILPEVILTITGVLVLMLDVFLPRNKGEYGAAIALLGILGAILTTFPKNLPQVLFSGSYIIDSYSCFFKIVLMVIVGLTISISINYIKLEDIDMGEFYALLIFSTLGLMIMVSSLNLITIYLGLEMSAVASCALVGFMVRDKKSNEAALKYFMLGVFSSGILLYGVSWLFGITGSLSLRGIADYLYNYSFIHNVALQLSLLLLIVGFGFKIGYVPFHMWVPDVYEGAPTSIAAFLSLGPKAAGFAVLLRLFVWALKPLVSIWTGIFWILAALTMLVGNIMALRQDNLKRMFGYSGIAHVGYMLIAASAFTKAPEWGGTAILFYFLVYIFMNLGPFGVIILLCRKKRIGDNISDFKGLSKSCPTAALVMTVFMLSLAGIPPTAGFIAKFLVFSSAIKGGFFWLAIIGVINSTIAVFYYLRVVVAMYIEEPANGGVELVMSPTLVVALGAMVALSLLIGIFPSIFIRIANQSVGALFLK